VNVGFKIGTPASAWDGPSMMAPIPRVGFAGPVITAQSTGNEGCVCGSVTGLRAKNLPGLPQMPSFDEEELETGPFVFALAAGGCVPCTTATVTLTTTGLGFWLGGGVGSIAMVGDGTVTASVSPTFINGCGNLTPTVNGNNYTYSGSDGDGISVGLSNDDSSEDCSACEQTISAGMMGMMAMSQQAIINRMRAIRRNAIFAKQMALRLKKKVTVPRSMPTSAPPTSSQ
jgi:hypothetical protein